MFHQLLPPLVINILVAPNISDKYTLVPVRQPERLSCLRSVSEQLDRRVAAPYISKEVFLFPPGF